MSYDIYIGNAEPDESWGQSVRHVTHSLAPTFPGDEMTGNGNGRHPGYSQWMEFCEQTGLYSLFFVANTGLMREHPGTFPLAPEHLAEVREARERWQAEHPAAVPGWDHDRFSTASDDGVRGRDGVLARLLWLEWWMDWALRECEQPAVHNH